MPQSFWSLSTLFVACAALAGLAWTHSERLDGERDAWEVVRQEPADAAPAESTQEAKAPPIQSQVLKTVAGERILLQTVRVKAPLDKVWAAYTTSKGWMAWAVPLAQVDLRAGGTIQTNYNAEAKIGDAGTNTLHILNYVPERMLTLQAELSDNWPEVMKKDAGRLMNVILFEADGQDGTRIESYGVGYADDADYDRLMQFFIDGNESLFKNLLRYLEDGQPALFGQ